MDRLVSLIHRIQKVNGSAAENFLHLVEEVGELSTELQKAYGDKRKPIDEGVAAEAVDVAVCALAIILNSFEGSCDTSIQIVHYIMQQMEYKLGKWERSDEAGVRGIEPQAFALPLNELESSPYFKH